MTAKFVVKKTFQSDYSEAIKIFENQRFDLANPSNPCAIKNKTSLSPLLYTLCSLRLKKFQVSSCCVTNQT